MEGWESSLAKSFSKIKLCLKEKGKGCQWGEPGNNRQLEMVNIEKEMWRKLVCWKSLARLDCKQFPL